MKKLVEEIYKDLQIYNSNKKSLNNYLAGLFDRYIAISRDLEKSLGNFKSQGGYYKPSNVSPESHKLNLKATYLELKMRIMGYIYQDIYKEPYLTRE